MSWRTDWMDCDSTAKDISRILDRVSQVTGFGEHQDEVSAALVVLNNQLENARRAIQIAEQKHLMDIANARWKDAQARLQELGVVVDV